MGPLPSTVLNALGNLGDAAASIFGSAVHLASVFLGGLALWAGVILGRWILNGCTFRDRRGGRRF